MDSKTFLKEVLTSDICPANFEKTYTEFQQYQQAAIDTLNEFHRVCEKNNIRYQLAYGSLLGAIRDNGQIPWDYDVDVFVPFCEKDALIEALKRDLKEEFYFYCPEINKKCRHFIMRIAPKEYNTSALHVDVFYLIGSNDNLQESKLLGQSVVSYINKRYYKLVNIKQESMGNKRRMVKLLLERIKNIFHPISGINKRFYTICTKYDMDDSKFCICADSESGKYIFETDKIWDTELITTSIGTFRISKNYEEILKKMYGDYKKIYPLEGRLKEVVVHYKRLKYFDHLH